MLCCGSLSISALVKALNRTVNELLHHVAQTFTVAEPVWLKYLQFHLISHHGNEPICALNDVLIFGKSAAEDLEDQLSDEALLTADDNPQQPDTALDPSAATDRPHAAVDVNKLDKSAAGGPQPDSSSGHAVKHSAAAVEANAGEMTNKSNMSDVLLPGKAASDASRQQSATEHASGGHQPGQQHWRLLSPCICSVCYPAFLYCHTTLTLVIYCCTMQPSLHHLHNLKKKYHLVDAEKLSFLCCHNHVNDVANTQVCTVHCGSCDACSGCAKHCAVLQVLRCMQTNKIPLSQTKR